MLPVPPSEHVLNPVSTIIWYPRGRPCATHRERGTADQFGPSQVPLEVHFCGRNRRATFPFPRSTRTARAIAAELRRELEAGIGLTDAEIDAAVDRFIAEGIVTGDGFAEKPVSVAVSVGDRKTPDWAESR